MKARQHQIWSLDVINETQVELNLFHLLASYYSVFYGKRWPCLKSSSVPIFAPAARISARQEAAESHRSSLTLWSADHVLFWFPFDLTVRVQPSPPQAHLARWHVRCIGISELSFSAAAVRSPPRAAEVVISASNTSFWFMTVISPCLKAQAWHTMMCELYCDILSTAHTEWELVSSVNSLGGKFPHFSILAADIWFILYFIYRKTLLANSLETQRRMIQYRRWTSLTDSLLWVMIYIVSINILLLLIFMPKCKASASHTVSVHKEMLYPVWLQRHPPPLGQTGKEQWGRIHHPLSLHQCWATIKLMWPNGSKSLVSGGKSSQSIWDRNDSLSFCGPLLGAHQNLR